MTCQAQCSQARIWTSAAPKTSLRICCTCKQFTFLTSESQATKPFALGLEQQHWPHSIWPRLCSRSVSDRSICVGPSNVYASFCYCNMRLSVSAWSTADTGWAIALLSSIVRSSVCCDKANTSCWQKHSVERSEWRGTCCWCLAMYGLYPLCLGYSRPSWLRFPLGPQRPLVPSWKLGSLT